MMVKMCHAVACVEDFVKSSHHCSTQYNLIKPGARSRLAPGFLELLLSMNVCVRVCLHVCVFACLPLRLLITSGMIWCDIDPIRLVK